MNMVDTPGIVAPADRETHLLDRIAAIQASVGNCLNDNEITRLLQRTALPPEGGFEFLSYGDHIVMFSVPPQDLNRWYREGGWITAAKEGLARRIAQKHELTLYEPPDGICGYPFPHVERPNPHHHLEMSFYRETIVVIHPRYLKVRLFRTIGATTWRGWTAHKSPQLGPELLPDFSALYQD